MSILEGYVIFKKMQYTVFSLQVCGFFYFWIIDDTKVFTWNNISQPYVYTHISIYTYTCTHVCVCVYVCVCIWPIPLKNLCSFGGQNTCIANKIILHYLKLFLKLTIQYINKNKQNKRYRYCSVFLMHTTPQIIMLCL